MIHLHAHAHCWSADDYLTLLVNWVSIIKLWTCFSALVNSNFLATTATTRAVHPAPCGEKGSLHISYKRTRHETARHELLLFFLQFTIPYFSHTNPTVLAPSRERLWIWKSDGLSRLDFEISLLWSVPQPLWDQPVKRYKREKHSP